MPATLTYPGVYVEEIASGVRTITGVSTSVAAFVGYFKRGIPNKPTRVFSFGDFVREFGGLDAESEASYGIQQFFLNGGAEAWVVRVVGAAAAAATVTLLDDTGATALKLEAGRGAVESPGLWGNSLRARVDHVPNTADRFNLTLSLVESRNGREVTVSSEKYLNLTNADKDDPRYAESVINDVATGSKLARVEAAGSSRPLANGTVSGLLSTFPTNITTPRQLDVSIGTEGTGTATLSKAPADLNEARGLLEAAIRQAKPGVPAFSEAKVEVIGSQLRILAGPTTAGQRIVFGPGGATPTAGELGLLDGEQLQGRMSGDLAGVFGTLPDPLSLDVKIGQVTKTVSLGASQTSDLTVTRAELETVIRAQAANSTDGFAGARVVAHTDGLKEHLIIIAGVDKSVDFVGGEGLKLSGPGTHRKVQALLATPNPVVPNVASGSVVGVTIGNSGPVQASFSTVATTLVQAATGLQDAVRAAGSGTAFDGAIVAPYGSGTDSRLVALAGLSADTVVFSSAPADTDTVNQLRLTTSEGAKANVQLYAFGAGAAIADTAQGAGVPGADALPGATELRGDPVAKTGLQALEDVDLFNLLCVPMAATLAGDSVTASGAQVLLSSAIAYCEKRRAFFLMDTPTGRDEPEEIELWLSQNSSLRHRNAALFYPRVLIPDPLNEFRLRSFGASGTVAGLFARIDSTRGVWKAPAGTEAVVRNVSKLEDVLTDSENGALNPLAINCLRNLPVYGHVVWGSRTLEGSDQAASEWKYIPVRRLALFLEESLYRGTQWVVFEPNDEPLWSQIRLNLGAFMHSLFRQGAFQGTTPRDAYFVKCDKETTTQNDINLGIVNIVIGFAPLKPAEFVVIKLQQMAGQLAT